MMNHISSWIAGIGMLIAVFLILSHANESARIINTISTNAINGIQVLQGRESYMK